MITSYRTLLTLGVTHTYYGGTSPDFEFIIPTDTQQMLGRGRILTREIDGVLNLLYEVSSGTTPVASLAGQRLRIGMRVKNPFFGNFTDLPSNFFTTIRRHYNGDTNSGPFDEWGTLPLVGSLFSHQIVDAARPIVVTLNDVNGTVVQTSTVAAGTSSIVSFDLRGKDPGAYTVVEGLTSPGSYYSDPMLLSRGASIVVEIYIDANSYITQWEYQIPPFSAKSQLLNYYVVTSGFTQLEVDSIVVEDFGFTEEGRPEVEFIKIPSASFTEPDELPLELLERGGDKIVLFRSAVGVAETPFPRRDGGRKKIRLSMNGDTLFEHLPQPGPDKTDSDMIIHISKP